MNTILEQLKNDQIWFQFFDIIRIIEPGGTYRVIKYAGNETIDLSLPCYSFWKRDERCANCISKRADKKQKPMMKLEYLNNKYYVVLAKPVEIDNEKYILELIMNITDQVQNDEEDSYIKKYLLDLVERLEDASSKDAFTGLYNKVYLKEVYEKYIKDPGRKKIYMSLMDMNNFKEINDTYGHDLGDEVILNVTNLLKEAISETDGIIARFGGDEFAVVFTGEEEEKCLRMLKQAKEKIDQADYSCNQVDFKAGISFGLAEVKDTEDFYEAIHEVDKQMYQSKKKDKK